MTKVSPPILPAKSECFAVAERRGESLKPRWVSSVNNHYDTPPSVQSFLGETLRATLNYAEN